DPEPFGHRVLALLGTNPGRHQFVEPAHTTAMDGGSAANAGCILRPRFLPEPPGIIAERLGITARPRSSAARARPDTAPRRAPNPRAARSLPPRGDREARGSASPRLA